MLAGIFGSNTAANLVGKLVPVSFLEVILGLFFGLAKLFEPDSGSPCHDDSASPTLYTGPRWLTGSRFSTSSLSYAGLADDERYIEKPGLSR